MSALVEAWRASRRESKATRARTMVGGVGDGALYGIANHELGARASRGAGWVGPRGRKSTQRCWRLLFSAWVGG